MRFEIGFAQKNARPWSGKCSADHADPIPLLPAGIRLPSSGHATCVRFWGAPEVLRQWVIPLSRGGAQHDAGAGDQRLGHHTQRSRLARIACCAGLSVIGMGSGPDISSTSW